MAEEHTLKDLVHALAEERGLDLRGYKLSTLERRIRRRMQQVNVGTYREYLDYIRRDQSETAKLLDTVLSNVTRFFRDVQAWDALAEQVLPLMFKGKPPGSTFRVWCAGCATGEEPYSVAILLCELLGPKVKDYEIKIYATDNDESALNFARRGEYTRESLRDVRPEIKAKYFTGQPAMRVARDVRRMVIFGKSNLLADAPISHVDLLLCRNVLIYLDAAAQALIIGRFRYALNDGGVLFLGKSESQLKLNGEFAPMNQRWRIFQRRIAALPGWTEGLGKKDMDPDLRDKAHQELEQLKLYYETVLATLEPGVLVLDGNDTVITENDKILKLWEFSNKLMGHKLQETELWTRCPELAQHMEESRGIVPKPIRFDCRATPNTLVTVTIKPILSNSAAGRVGTLIYMENVSSRVTLQSTIEELETTAEELQSTNQELETTNEELQSTNEELETTNEELQSTNEELETTNEELSSRTRELDEVNARYSEMMERMPWPVLLVNNDALIYMFNSAAQKLFGFAHPSERGMKLQELPLDTKARHAMLRRHRTVLHFGKKSLIKNFHLTTNRFNGVVDVHFTPLSTDTGHGVIVMFQVERRNKVNSTKKNPAGKSEPSQKKKAGVKKKKNRR